MLFSRGSFRPGIEPASLALVGGFSTTEPPGKPEFGRGNLHFKFQDLQKNYFKGGCVQFPVTFVYNAQNMLSARENFVA